MADLAEFLHEAKRRTDAGTMTKSRFESLEKTAGLKCNPLGMLCDRQLLASFDPISACTYDWVHNVLQDGIFTTESWLFLQACEACEGIAFRHSDVHRFLKDGAWEFPKASRPKAVQLHRVFDSYRVGSSTEADKLKASAGELLGLYALLRHYVERHIGPRPEVAAQRASFDAVCSIIDLVLLCKRGRMPPADASEALRRACIRHLELFQIAYGEQHLRPKHHWQLDMSEQPARDGCVLDAFVVERMHLSVKRIAEMVRNTSTFERSVMSGVVNQRFKSAADGILFNGLGHPYKRWRRGWVANSLTFATLQVYRARGK